LEEDKDNQAQKYKSFSRKEDLEVKVLLLAKQIPNYLIVESHFLDKRVNQLGIILLKE
jgi:hypothetical protein